MLLKKGNKIASKEQKEMIPNSKTTRWPSDKKTQNGAHAQI
jgi:hypothetical protein